MRIATTGLGLMLAFGAIAPARADCTARSAQTQAHLIELYTSEGCSSCPPADRWLSALPADAQRIPLAFHVDYWDSPGWKDRFADPRFTERQRALAAQSSSTVVYTPEVTLDGREWRNWNMQTFPATAAAPALGLVLHVDSIEPLRVHVETTPAADADTGAYLAYLAVSEDRLSSVVRGGENNGTVLHHDHVVRAFVGPLSLAQVRAQVPIEVPAGVRRERASVVAFVQRAQNGEVANVVQLPLAQCASPGAG